MLDSLLKKVDGLNACNFIEKRLPKENTFAKKRFWHRCFPVSFAKNLRTPFLQSTSG